MSSSLAGATRRCVLVTAFGPFGGYAHNPSQDVVDAFAGRHELRAALDKTGHELVTDKLTVSYEHVDEAVPQLWKKHRPELVVHVGVDGSRPCVNVERRAPNVGYVRRDVAGRVPLGNRCSLSTGAERCLRTGLDVPAIVQRANDDNADLPDGGPDDARTVRQSDGVGSYLCGYSYYRSLEIESGRSLFVHIPEPTDRVTVQFMAGALARIVAACLEQIGGEKGESEQ